MLAVACNWAHFWRVRRLRTVCWGRRMLQPWQLPVVAETYDGADTVARFDRHLSYDRDTSEGRWSVVCGADMTVAKGAPTVAGPVRADSAISLTGP